MNKVKHYYFLTFLSPILGVILATQGLSWSARKKILILAITLFGSTIILSTSDGYMLQQQVYTHYVGLSFSQWLFELKQMLLFNPEPGTKGDVFFHVLSYLVGQVLAVPNFYFFFISLLYAYIYTNILSKILIWDKSGSKSILFWGVIVTFVGYQFIDNLQYIRTPLGMWVLFSGVYGYHQTDKVKYLFLMMAAPLFHVAYFLMALPAYAVVFIKRSTPKMFILGYLLSFTLALNPSGIINQLETTELGKSKVAGYYQENPQEYQNSDNDKSANFYRVYGRNWALPNAPHILIFAIVLMGLYSKAKMTKLEIGLFSTGILMATMANLGDFVPAFYNRTMANSGNYILATLVTLLLRGELFRTKAVLWRKSLLWISLLAFSPYLIYVLANMLQFTSIFMIVMPIAGLFEGLNMSLREFIGFFLF